MRTQAEPAAGSRVDRTGWKRFDFELAAPRIALSAEVPDGTTAVGNFLRLPGDHIVVIVPGEAFTTQAYDERRWSSDDCTGRRINPKDTFEPWAGRSVTGPAGVKICEGPSGEGHYDVYSIDGHIAAANLDCGVPSMEGKALALSIAEICTTLRRR